MGNSCSQSVVSLARSRQYSFLVVVKYSRSVAALAHTHYHAANAVLAKKPKGRLATPALMGAVYSEILAESEKAGFAAPRRRVSLSKWRLLTLVARVGLG